MGGQLDGRIAVVTGTARGIGRAIARRFAAEGARVHGVDLLTVGSRSSTSRLSASDDRVCVHAGDVSKEDDVTRVVREALTEDGHIDVLVNNAAIQFSATLVDATVDEARRMIDTNILGPILFCREVLPGMMDRRSGRIINLSSVLGKVGDPVLPVYGATKAAILGLSKSIAAAYGQYGIRCNVISPGDVDTELNQEYFASHDDPVAFRARVELEYPLRRIASVDEIANVAVFLAADESSFVTGADIVVDGGILSRIYEV